MEKRKDEQKGTEICAVDLYHKYNDKRKNSCYSYSRKKKADERKSRKESTMMNTVMTNSYLYYSESYYALNKKQGLYLVHSFKIAKSNTV